MINLIMFFIIWSTNFARSDWSIRGPYLTVRTRVRTSQTCRVCFGFKRPAILKKYRKKIYQQYGDNTIDSSDDEELPNFEIVFNFNLEVSGELNTEEEKQSIFSANRPFLHL